MRKCKTTSFDLTDPHENEILKYAIRQGKYSKYVKRLIAEDMAQNTAKSTTLTTEMTDATTNAMNIPSNIESFF